MECPTADYPGGISYDAGFEDLTVVVDPGSTLEGGFQLSGDANLAAQLSGVTISTTADFQAGISLNSPVGNLSILTSGVSTAGDGAAGIYAHGGAGYTLIYAGSVVTSGDNGDGVQAIGTSGYQVVVADYVRTAGEGSAGISVGSKSGDIRVLAFDIATSGNDSAAVQLSTDSGNIVFQEGKEIVFSDIRTTGDQSDGVDLTTVDGNIASFTTSISTAGVGSTGVNAASTNGNVAIYNGFGAEFGGIKTTGDYSDGIHVESGRSSYIQSDTVYTYGNQSDAISVAAGGDLAVVSNTIRTFGEGSSGLDLSTYSGTLLVAANEIDTIGNYSQGIHAVSQTGGITISANSVDTSGDYAGGIVAFIFGSDAGGSPPPRPLYSGDIIIDAGSLTTSGAHSGAVYAANDGGGNVRVAAGSLNTSGDYSPALHAASFGHVEQNGAVSVGDVEVKAGNVSTSGDFAYGIQATSVGGSVDVDAGSISTSGDRSIGVLGGALGYQPEYGSFYGGDLSIAADEVITVGDHSNGVQAISFSGGNTTIAVGRVDTSGEYSTGIYAATSGPFNSTEPQALEVTVGSAVTHGASSDAVKAVAIGGDIQIDAGRIATYGNGSSGIVALGSGDIAISAATVGLYVGSSAEEVGFSAGIYAVTDGGNVVITADEITTEGDKSSGIVASSNGTSDYYGVAHVGDVTVDAGTVATQGGSSVGIAATSFGGSISVHAGEVTTDGDDSIGVAVNGFAFTPGYGASTHLLYNGDVTVDIAKVVTKGDYSNGVSVFGFGGGDTTATIGTVQTSGDHSYGVNVVTSGQANYYTGEFYGGATSVTVDKVVTTGDAANGVRIFAFTGDVDLTVGSVEVSGQDSDAVLGLNGSNGSVTISVLEEARSKQGFGVVASAYDDVDVNIAEGAAVYGGKVGIYTSTYHDGAVATITNHGEISSPGVAIMSEYGPVVVDNPGTIIGRVLLGQGDDNFDNSGTWMLWGDNSFGGGGDLLTNSGRVIVSAKMSGGMVKITDLETFNNSGLVGLVDNQAGQTFDIAGAAFAGTGASTVALDISNVAGALIADKLKIGAASGATKIVVTGSPAFGRALVVDAQSATGAGNFALAGASDIGFIRLSLDYDPAKSDWALFAAPDTEVFESTRIASNAQSLWRRSVDAWSQRQRDNRTDERAGFRLWGNYLGGHERVGKRDSFDILGTTFAPALDTESNWNGFQLGADFRRGNWAVGVMGGDVSEKTRFTADGNRLSLHGVNLGAYAAYQAGKVFLDGLVDYQHVGGRTDLATAGFGDGLSGHVLGVRGDAGLRLALGSLFVEPEVGLSWSTGTMNDLSAAGAQINFKRLRSAEVHAGARLSSLVSTGSLTVRPYAGLYALNQLSGENALDFTLGGQTLRLNDRARPGYAQGTAGAIVDWGRGFRFSVGGQTDFLGGHRAWKGQIGLSWHG